MPPSSQAAYQSLQAFKPREAKDVMGEAEAKYDIAGRKDRLSSLRGLVGNLQSSVEAVDPSVTARTSGTFSTEGQRSALVNRERQPLLGDLARQQSALGMEQQGFSESQSLASQMASALMSQDQTTYQRLLDQYNASMASEQAAEARRQYEMTLAEQKRQFDEQQRAQAAAQRAASSGGGYDVGSIVRAITGGSSAQTAARAPEAAQRESDAQYLGKVMSEQNPAARLQLIASLRRAAKNGNAQSARRFELGKQLGYWKF